MLALLLTMPLLAAVPQITYTPRAPFHIESNRLVDATGRPFVLRGTAMPFRTPEQEAVLNADVFSQIAQRWNMNVLRLQISVAMDLADPTYLDHVKRVVHDANAVDLAVILAPHDEDDTSGAPTARMVPFWTKWAAAFRDEPRVMFDLYSEPKSTLVPGYRAGTHSAADWRFWQRGGLTADGQVSPGMQALASGVRATGSRQVILAMIPDENPLLEGVDPSDLLTDSNTVYEICPLHADNPTDADRDRHFGIASAGMPVIANNWDLQLDKDNAECQAIPTAPGAAAALIKADLEYFDAHGISWTSSFFTPGKLIQDNLEFFPTKLNAAWTCGHPANQLTGMGDVVRFHLWGAADDAAIPVNGAAGGLAIAPGSVAVVYAEPELTRAASLDAGTMVMLTDAAGNTRLASMLYVAPSGINFTVPADLAPGLARIAVINEGGPNPVGSVVMQPVAPGLFTLTGNGRGPVVGFTVDGGVPIFDRPVDLSGGAPVLVRLVGTGFRSVRDLSKFSVTIGGKAVPVVSAGVLDERVGTDQLVIAIGVEFAGMGETDLIFRVADQPSNAVRITLGR